MDARSWNGEPDDPWPSVEDRDPGFRLIYPERRAVTPAWLIQQAKDYLATEYMRAYPQADDAAIAENARVSSVYDAITVLEDAGLVTMERIDHHYED